MRKVKPYEYEVVTPTPYPENKNWNKIVVETAGFVPLAVRFKQMEQAGIRAQFFASEFTSQDVQDMYLNHPEFDLSPEDDIEEAMEKIQARQAWIQHVKNEARKRNAAEDKEGIDAAAPSKKESNSAAKAAVESESEA